MIKYEFLSTYIQHRENLDLYLIMSWSIQGIIQGLIFNTWSFYFNALAHIMILDHSFLHKHILVVCLHQNNHLRSLLSHFPHFLWWQPFENYMLFASSNSRLPLILEWEFLTFDDCCIFVREINTR